MPYSAVTHPRPVLRRKGGTRSSTLAAHSTWVSPKRMRHDPSAYLAAPGSSVTGRISSAARPDGRIPCSSSPACRYPTTPDGTGQPKLARAPHGVQPLPP